MSLSAITCDTGGHRQHKQYNGEDFDDPAFSIKLHRTNGIGIGF